MFVRHLGCGIGHLDLQARLIDKIIFEGFDAEAALAPNAHSGESGTFPPPLDEHEDELDPELDDEDDLVEPEDLFAEL